LTRAKTAGAADGINYKTHPDWEKEVMRLTGGHGADIVVEVGGVGTLMKSFQSLAFEGKVALIGVLTREGDTNPHMLMMKGAALQGIFVGNGRMFMDMLRAIEVNGIKPAIDRVFDFAEAREAYDYLAAGKHFGKVVIKV
jgi:NADPH:quinone reductase-like Zn-dependent oxidoreductase